MVDMLTMPALRERGTPGTCHGSADGPGMKRTRCHIGSVVMLTGSQGDA